MKVNEEVDAMRTLGLDPMEVLVMPRVIALVLVLPLLTFYADVMGLLGGAVMATVVLDISFFQFARQLNDAVRSEEHTSELQSLMRISYAVFCLKKKTKQKITQIHTTETMTH